MSDDAPNPTLILAALGVNGSERITPVAGGADTAIWRVRHAGQTSALRLFRPNQLSVSRREIAALRAAADGGIPVPEIRAEGVWQDRPALLLSWMPGVPIADAVLARPWQAWALGVAFGRLQASIHRVAAPAALLDQARPWMEWGNPDSALRQRLQAVTSESHTLLHLDYHPLNVLGRDGGATAVLDWVNARAGDHRADLARTASILRFMPIRGALPAPVSSAVRWAMMAGWRRGYRELAGGVSGMAPFYSWAGAVMVHDLSPRLGRTDLPWLTQAYLDQVGAWAAFWRTRAGLPGRLDSA